MDSKDKTMANMAAGLMDPSSDKMSILKTHLSNGTHSPSEVSKTLELVGSIVNYMDQNVPQTPDSSQSRIESANSNKYRLKAPESSQIRIQIARGDTLWGFSRKYGVSIDAIKKANGLKGDTIYAGKKLIIP